MATAGYSGTPLAKKLGIISGSDVALIDEPDGFRSLLDPLPPEVEFQISLRVAADVVVMFVTKRADFERQIEAAGRAIYPYGGLWIAWPKQAAVKRLQIDTDMTEDVVREVALPLDLVDNKVCAIDDTWSGLRIVWRSEVRGSAS